MKHTFEGHEIEVEAYASPSMLWFGVGLRVMLDGREIARSTNRFEGLTTRVPFEIALGNATTSGVVVSEGVASVLRTRYTLSIGDHHVGSGRLRARNWYITYGIILVACAIALAWVIRVAEA